MKKERRPFKGSWCPAILHHLIQRGPKRKGLSAKAGWLALIIDSYSRRNGCFASEATLAKKLNVGIRQLRNLIRHLASRGVLTEGTENGMRNLRINWDGWGNKFPEAGNKFTDPGKKFPKPKPKNENLARVLREKNEMGWDGDKYSREELADNVRSGGADSVGDASPYGYSSTKKLLAGLGKRNKILRKPNLKKSAVEFDQLFREVKERERCTCTESRTKVNRTMKKYLNGIDKHSHWPWAYSPAAFRQKFVQIEAAIRRAEKNGEAERDAPKAKVIHEGNGHTRYVLSLEDN